MEKLKQTDIQKEGSENLDALFMELFTPEFLGCLPPEQIETVINTLKQVESSSKTIPDEWAALRNALRERGYLEQSYRDRKGLDRPAQQNDRNQNIY